MEFQSRSYNPGTVFRPKPFILRRPESSLMIVTTSWGHQGEDERVANQILEKIEKGVGSEETTSVSQRSLSWTNRLRRALIDVGQTIYKQDNAKQLRLLIEALVVQIEGNEVTWAQTGQPNLYLLRRGRLAPLVVQPDHSILNPGLAPLPSVGLGLEPQTPVQAGSAAWMRGDQLLMLAQAWDPQWLRSNDASPDFQKLTAELIRNQPELAFWCGQISF